MPDTTKIIENGYVFTSDPNNRSGVFSVLVKNDRIVEVSTRGDLFKTLNPNAEVIDASGKVIFPGFVDAHLHGESIVLQRFTLSTPMSRWQREPDIRNIIEFIQNDSTVEDQAVLYRLSAFAALKSGVTTVSEFGGDRLEFSLASVHDAFRRAELRGFIGLQNGDQIELARAMKQNGIRFSIPLPTEVDLTTYNLQTTLRLARDLQVPVVAHWGETKQGQETIKKNFHRTIVQLLNEYRLFEVPIQLTHLACLDPEDFTILEKCRVPIVVSPTAVLQKGADIPSFGELLRRNIPLVFGTDWGLPMPFENIRSFIAILRSMNVEAPSAFEMLAMHTRSAARALGVAADIGSIESGKKADLAFADVSDHRLAGFESIGDERDRLLFLLNRLTSSDISDVMVNGEFFVRQHHLLTYAEEDLIKEQKLLVEKLNRLARPRQPQKSQGAIPAPIIPLNVRTVDEEEHEGVSEEGFRIVNKNQPMPPITPKPAVIPEEAKTVTKKQINKIFGEDDV